MSKRPIHQCQCPICQSEEDRLEKTIHHQINVVMSRLDEQQRRWYAAVEANRHGYGGATLVSNITGLDEKTIRRGQRELALDLADRPDDRIRLPGAGRPPVEKKRYPRQQVDGSGAR
ncbi:MAG: transposase [Chloroflexi bacterium]|nr:transposase [Chloroflexota bacterium]